MNYIQPETIALMHPCQILHNLNDILHIRIPAFTIKRHLKCIKLISCGENEEKMMNPPLGQGWHPASYLAPSPKSFQLDHHQ